MASISVDVDIDEFDDDDIFQAASERINIVKRNNVKRDKLIRDIQPLIDELSGGQIPVKSLDDKMKIEHLMKVWDKYNSFQLSELLPE